MGATCHACIGGTNVRNEMQKLQAEAPHIVVGTPGRVFDMLNRRYLCKQHSSHLKIQEEIMLVQIMDTLSIVEFSKTIKYEEQSLAFNSN